MRTKKRRTAAHAMPHDNNVKTACSGSNTIVAACEILDDE
jgi:hypothetical protein